MRRDMDLIRQIAFIIESSDDSFNSETINIANYSQSQIGYHCELMNESGLLDAIDTRTMQSDYATFHIRRLTTKGHDFVDAARSDTLWNKARATISSTVGGVAIDVLIRYLKTQAASALGLPTE